MKKKKSFFSNSNNINPNIKYSSSIKVNILTNKSFLFLTMEEEYLFSNKNKQNSNNYINII